MSTAAFQNKNKQPNTANCVIGMHHVKVYVHKFWKFQWGHLFLCNFPRSEKSKVWHEHHAKKLPPLGRWRAMNHDNGIKLAFIRMDSNPKCIFQYLSNFLHRWCPTYWILLAIFVFMEKNSHTLVLKESISKLFRKNIEGKQ